MKRVGILTGGGDAPGLNAVINSVLIRGKQLGMEIIGIEDGWKGLMTATVKTISANDTSLLIQKGGTILGSSRTNPYKEENGVAEAINGFKKLKLDALIAIGGDDTLGVANKLSKEGLPIVGVPKTIDNDLSATDFCIGFDTSVNIIMDSIQNLHTTAGSHHRVIVVEVMGRHAGWMTLVGGIAGGANIILIPEVKSNIEEIYQIVSKRSEEKNHTIIAVAEGIKIEKLIDIKAKDVEKDSFGNIILAKLGIGESLAKAISEKTNVETRFVVLGHLQRAGPPSAFDRYLGTRLGVEVTNLIEKKKWGYMVVMKGNEIIPIPLEDSLKERRMVPENQANLTKIMRS
ncbi:MAG: 6-phosphofructokinase [Candidatus Ranarchaeia archaeon]